MATFENPPSAYRACDLARAGTFALLVTLLGGASAAAPAAESDAGGLADLTLEQLAKVKVTSVSKHPQSLSSAPASIYVITAEKIRRSGATTLPEALRLAPNLEVARVGASQYAISARGFNSTTANKLLVLIDGRTVYTPLFSGVFWDAQDVMLEDVDRIEVISGPGATLWGANAVNGVINVVTRRASETRGGLAVAALGNRERDYAARYGVGLGGGGSLRVYGKAFKREHASLERGGTASDGWNRGQAGFRADWGSAAEGLTVQGDAYRGTEDRPGTRDSTIAGANLLAHWTHQLAGGGSVSLQGYFDNTHREIPGVFSEDLNTLDVEFQHNLRPIARNAVTWGLGHRTAFDDVGNTAALAFLPAERTLHWSNAFVQDEIALIERRLHLTLGVKLERNSFTGIDFLPSGRIAWQPAADQLLWAAVSRAVRAPSRIDREFFVPGTPPFLLAGGPDFESETSDVVEFGYRAQPTVSLSYSVSVYRSFHDRLRSLEPTAGGGFVIDNKMEGTTTGVEAWGDVQVLANWRLGAGGFLLWQDLHLQSDSGDPNGTSAAGNDPKYQWMLRSSLDLPAHTELDVQLRRVGPLPSPEVPGYTALDVRGAWRPHPDLELSLVAQNLFDAAHPEFGPAATRSEIQRSVYVGLKWSF